MKKIFTILIITFYFATNAQNSILIKEVSSSSSIAANATINLVTSPNSNTNKTFDIKNIGSSTNTYVVIRYDKVLNSGADAYFCFAGTCFGSLTTMSGSLILTAGQSASQFTTAYQMLTTDLDESSIKGFSHIKYTFRNALNNNDSLQINLLYNNPASGIFEQGLNKTNISVFPNPAKDQASVLFKTAAADKIIIQIIDVTGKIIKNQTIKSTTTDFNNVTINTHDIAEGTYNLVISNEKKAITEKIIIVK
jgi:hypothetical protein